VESLGHFNYWLAIVIIMIGFYGVIAKKNLIKQAIALGLFQTGVFLFYVSMGVVRTREGIAGVAPIWTDIEKTGPFDNPLPHVLMLTAIVVSVSTLAVAIAIIVNIKREYGTIEEDEILDANMRTEAEDRARRSARGRAPSNQGSAKRGSAIAAPTTVAGAQE